MRPSIVHAAFIALRPRWPHMAILCRTLAPLAGVAS